MVRATRAAGPARRSEPLALALVFLGAGAAVVGVFHDRIGSLQLGKDGIKIDLTEAEGAGAAQLVERLAAHGAAPATYARGVAAVPGGARVAAGPCVGLAGRSARPRPRPSTLANRIADELV